MNDLLQKLLGSNSELTWYQMADRTVIVFILMVVLIRISGRRSFGIKSPFDVTITILLGAILGRTVVGASAFIPTIAAATTLVFLHLLFAWLCIRYHKFGVLVKGNPVLLYSNGQIHMQALERSLLSIHDLMEGIRLSGNKESLQDIESVYLERNGKISVIKKQVSA